MTWTIDHRSSEFNRSWIATLPLSWWNWSQPDISIAERREIPRKTHRLDGGQQNSHKHARRRNVCISKHWFLIKRTRSHGHKVSTRHSCTKSDSIELIISEFNNWSIKFLSFLRRFLRAFSSSNEIFLNTTNYSVCSSIVVWIDDFNCSRYFARQMRELFFLAVNEMKSRGTL